MFGGVVLALNNRLPFLLAGGFAYQHIVVVSLVQSQSIVLLFLVFSLNHARVPLVMFGYTTSCFFFLLAAYCFVNQNCFVGS
jgi:hypothetical protein